MSGFSNVVRFVVKEGSENDFLKVFKTFSKEEGEIYSFLVQTGDREYVAVGTWESEDALVNARPAMIGNLDKMRDFLEEISPELGVTDPRSGNIITEWK
ncbi:antibiotic biosynthesis monooxygenase [SAR86 cluster bacterium]|nr:antibiotic biosynthesis monooxygenase [SAR86 cluster bacterium]